MDMNMMNMNIKLNIDNNPKLKFLNEILEFKFVNITGIDFNSININDSAIRDILKSIIKFHHISLRNSIYEICETDKYYMEYLKKQAYSIIIDYFCKHLKKFVLQESEEIIENSFLDSIRKVQYNIELHLLKQAVKNMYPDVYYRTNGDIFKLFSKNLFLYNSNKKTLKEFESLLGFKIYFNIYSFPLIMIDKFLIELPVEIFFFNKNMISQCLSSNINIVNWINVICNRIFSFNEILDFICYYSSERYSEQDICRRITIMFPKNKGMRFNFIKKIFRIQKDISLEQYTNLLKRYYIY